MSSTVGGEPERLSDYVIQEWLDHMDGVGDVAYEAAFYPQVFAELVRGDFGLSLEELAAHVGTAWGQGGDLYLPRDESLYLFEIAGYRENDDLAARPTAPLRLWRGATPALRRNWSWANRRDAALMFASGGWFCQEETGLVWSAVVEPERLLAKIDYTRGNFAEYIVDTEGLTIEPDGLWCRCPTDLTPFRGNDREAQIALDIHELAICPRR